MALLPPSFLIQLLDNAGLPAAGAKLHTYDSGTTTPKATYTDQAGGSANTNPITLDSAGRCTLWLGSGEYTFVLKNPADAVTLWTRDDVGGVPASVTGSYVPLAGGTMTGLLTLSGNASSALNPVPKQQVESLIAAATSTLIVAAAAAVPVGTIGLWLTGTPPTNWLALKGQAVSRSTYASLFALWGTTFGTGDGSTTFTLPETRGEFPRFWDDSRGVDSGRAIGTAQADDFKSHAHLFLGESETLAAGYVSAVSVTYGCQNDGAAGGGDYRTKNDTVNFGGAETRPRNFAMTAIVKAL